MSKENLAKAKARLIIDHPFFASLLLSMPMKEDNSQPTICTNGEEIRYNSQFMAAHTVPEMVFLLAHETMHCVLQHMTRLGARDPMRFNIAGDFIINELLVNDKVGAMPKGLLYNPEIVKRGGGTTEGVYNLLPESDKSKQVGQPGGPHDFCEQASKDPAEIAAKESEMKVKLIQAASAAKMCGKLSAGLERLVGSLTRSKVDWKSVLRRFFTDRAKVDLTYARPKRRFLADDLNLPSLNGVQMGSVVFAVDCSGSIDEKLLARFTAEMAAIQEDTRPIRVHVLYFDAEILRHDQFSVEEPITCKPIGGGGTAFSPIFQYVEKHDLNPLACVVLTDLCCNDFGSQPSYPVLWASTMDGNAPWGEVLRIEG